jgi:hypothetical protein
MNPYQQAMQSTGIHITGFLKTISEYKPEDQTFVSAFIDVIDSDPVKVGLPPNHDCTSYQVGQSVDIKCTFKNGKLKADSLHGSASKVSTK